MVQTYVDTHDIGKVIARQDDILELYRLDIAQYAAGSDKPKIRAIFDSIPAQLNDKNRRFILHDLDANGRQLRYPNSFAWLSNAGVALPATMYPRRKPHFSSMKNTVCSSCSWGMQVFCVQLAWKISSLGSCREIWKSTWAASWRT